LLHICKHVTANICCATYEWVFVLLQASNLLYAGTRRGAIYCYEAQKRIGCFQHKSSVYALCATADDRQLIAADFSGKVKLVLLLFICIHFVSAFHYILLTYACVQ